MGAEDGATNGENLVVNEKNVSTELTRLGQEFATWLYGHSKNERVDVQYVTSQIGEKFKRNFARAMMNAIAGKGETKLGYVTASIDAQKKTGSIASNAVVDAESILIRAARNGSFLLADQPFAFSEALEIISNNPNQPDRGITVQVKVPRSLQALINVHRTKQEQSQTANNLVVAPGDSEQVGNPPSPGGVVETAKPVPEHWSAMINYLKGLVSSEGMSAQDLDRIVQAVSATDKRSVLVEVADFQLLKAAIKNSELRSGIYVQKRPADGGKVLISLTS